MHVALIIDEERLRREHPALNRVTVGLLAEAVRITRIVPDTLTAEATEETARRVALAPQLEVPMRVLPWMRGDRAGRLAAALDRACPDVLLALGERAWGLGLDLARRLERPLAIDVSSAAQIRRVPRGRRAAAVGAYIAPTRPMADALRRHVHPDLVALVPAGVAYPDTPRPVLADPDRAIALAILGGARDVPAYRALLAGLSRVIRPLPQIQAVLELDGPHEHEIWRDAHRLGLLDHVSSFGDASRHRTLLTRCDAILLPEQYGEFRSILLESMAFGLPVIAADDPYLDMLIGGETAAVVSGGDAESWSSSIRRLLTDPDAARALGLAGRRRIAERHRSSTQIAGLATTLERIATGGSYSFEDLAV